MCPLQPFAPFDQRCLFGCPMKMMKVGIRADEWLADDCAGKAIFVKPWKLRACVGELGIKCSAPSKKRNKKKAEKERLESIYRHPKLQFRPRQKRRDLVEPKNP